MAGEKMTTYHTNNPLGSTDPRDLYDNAQNFDYAINGTTLTWVNRLGVTSWTMVGYRSDYDNVVANLAPLGKVYPSLSGDDGANAAIGSGEIQNGAIFFVRGLNDESIADEYKNISGVATPTGKSYPTTDLIRKLLPQYRFSSSYVALHVDESGKVPIWLDNSKFNAAGVGDYTINYIFNNSSSFNAVSENVDILNTKLPNYRMSSSYYAGIIDESGEVPLWFDGGMLDAAGIGPRLKESILNYITENITLGTQLSYTDARTIWLWRANRSKLRNAFASKLKIGFTGDSWTEKKAIPQSMADTLYTEYPKSGEGWIQLNIDGDNQLNSIVFNRANWTVYDASTTSLAPTYGCALDGMSIYTTGTDATINITNLTATTINIYYYDGEGAFRYRIDGGGWTTVTGAGTNKPLKVVVTGLTNTTHTLDIDTTVNAGTAVIYGFYAAISNTGVEIQKFGNGGITAPQYAKVLPYIDYFAKELSPDVMLMIIGTNDFRNSITISDFTTALSNWVATYKASLPNSAIILIAPPQNNATGSYPLSSYRDAMRKVASTQGVEFYDLFVSFPETYAQSNAVGLWADSLHLNSNGAKFLVDEINKYFL